MDRFVYNTTMILEQIRRSFVILIFFVSLIIFIWGMIPNPNQVRTLPISADDLFLSEDLSLKEDNQELEVSSSENQLLQPNSPVRYLNLHFPSKIRVGDTAVIRLSLDMLPKHLSTKKTETQQSENKVDLLNEVSDAYHIIIETRLELAGFEYLPTGGISEALLPLKGVVFYWNVRPRQQGFYHGTIWVYVKYLPKDGGQEVRQLLTAQTVDLESIVFFGLNGEAARISGSIGLVIGLLMSLNSFLRRKQR